ncbi:hypothetical protein DQ238_11330 [Geodermatophilus sp. TF02-6]|uniref:DUF6398 domain-containing protein n=1 Tax=Geodermatophilus sp. TF02-6 TaxID=2250575 RepID=UPI000DE8F7F7|nr:DUF6398 domain-containing protein [Geodermatophilus sp. TF02-6]RBY78961.1 hypothetical protein DQ238_11330 [Geodermatophilus sp. TF02-6]
MPKRSRRPTGGQKKARRPGKGRAPRRTSRVAPSRRGGPDLIDEVADALAADHPLPFLGLVSSFLEVLAGRPTPLQPREPGLPSLEELLDSFFEADLPETSALLAGIAGLSGDEVLRSRVRRETAARGDVLPRWLAQLDRSSATDRAVQVRHVLGDGDDLVFGVRLTDGSDVSVVVYVDHNLGTLVKDAFVAPRPLPELVEAMRTAMDDPDSTFEDIDPADARARITEAVELGAMTYPPLESDTWPACRPFVEWAVGLLPAGGTGYRRPEWTEADQQALADRFLASPYGAGLGDPDARALLDSLLWFGTDYGPGDPMRWSPVAVEILLADWIPRKIVADVAHLSRAPELLRAFVRFCHAERGIRPELTAQTLAAVDALEPAYQETIRTPRPQGPEALLAAMSALDPGGPWPSPQDFTAPMREELSRVVGGAAALDRLDDEPLPDEPFRWDGVPAEAGERVAEVLDLVDRFADEVLDVELRTAARRVLAEVSAADPALVRRARAASVAAAICWIVAKANGVFSDSGLAVKDLAGWFGVGATTPAQRAKPILQALGVDPSDFAYGLSPLGSPDHLTAATRAEVIAARDRLR